MNNKTNLLFLLLVFLSVQLTLGLSDQDCSNTQPTNKTSCNNLDIGANKKCCFFTFGSPQKMECSPISVTSFDTMMTEIEAYKSNQTDQTNFEYQCNTRLEICSKIINPAKDLACTGREMEAPYSCCKISDEKDNRSCVPIDARDFQTIIAYAQSYKRNNQLAKDPSVICGASTLASLSLIAYLAVIYI